MLAAAFIAAILTVFFWWAFYGLLGFAAIWAAPFMFVLWYILTDYISDRFYGE
jgi:hypothetical protein